MTLLLQRLISLEILWFPKTSNYTTKWDTSHAAKSTAQQFPEEIGPERFRFAAADFESQYLASTLGVDAQRQSSGHRDDATAFPNLDVSGIQPKKRPLAVIYHIISYEIFHINPGDI